MRASNLASLFVGDQILIFHHNLQINSLKILQCDFLDFFSYFVSHSWGIPMMKITGLSHLFKWENLHNWWLTKYFFAPLYINIYIYIYTSLWHFAFITIGQIRTDRKRSEDGGGLNSGHPWCDVTACRRAAHKAIGANNKLIQPFMITL